jgi:hypothetical protein
MNPDALPSAAPTSRDCNVHVEIGGYRAWVVPHPRDWRTNPDRSVAWRGTWAEATVAARKITKQLDGRGQAEVVHVLDSQPLAE